MSTRCYGCMKLKESRPVCEHCGHNETKPNYPHQLPVGTVLQGRYRIGKALGQGGFGITYIGWDGVLDAPVAVKEYYPNSFVHRDSRSSTMVTCAGDEAEEMYRHNRDRFLREAKILAKLNNVPGIVRVQNLFGANNTAYIVMEYVEGIDLKRYLKKQDRVLTVPEMLHILRPVLDALEKVHDAELVHRDISPDNIMILPDGSAKLLDFGAAREVVGAAVDKELPQSTEAILKHGFAPMEQYRRRGNLGPWTDVYGLCATIYYCLTGKVPNSAPERITGDDNIDWYKVPGLTRQQAAALEKGMALLPEKRIRSVGELRKKLLPEKKMEAAKPGKKLELPKFLKKTEQIRPEKKAEPPKVEKKVEPPKVERKPEPPKVERKPEPPKVERKPEPPKVERKPEPPKVERKPELPKVERKTDPPKVEKKAEPPKVEKKVEPPKIEKQAAQDYAPTMPVAQEKPKAGKKTSPVPVIGAAAVVAAVVLGVFLMKGKPEPVLQEVVGTNAAVSTEAAQLSAEELAYNEEQYSEAVRLEEAGETAKAAMAFGKLGDYSDARERSFGLWDKIAVRDSIGISESRIIGLKSNGTVVAVNSSGDIDLDWTDIVSVSSGELHTVGLKEDGTVRAFGYHQMTLPDGTVIYPQKLIGEWTDIVAVSAGGYHTVGLKSDGTVVAVGINDQGQCDVAEWTDIVAVSAGAYHTVGLKSDGTVVAVGYDVFGQSDVTGWTDIVAVSAGEHYTIGIKSDGTVVIAGTDFLDEENVTGWTDIVAVGAGHHQTIGLKSDGTVVADGLDWVVHEYEDGTGWSAQQDENSQCDVSGWTDMVAVYAGTFHTVGLKSDGTVVALSNNEKHQFDVSGWSDIKIPEPRIPYGNGSATKPEGSPEQQAQYAEAEKLLASGETAKAAIAFGKLGDYSDARVRSFSLWNQVAKRDTIATGDVTTVGLRSDSTVLVVGSNAEGQCYVSDWTNVVAIGADESHTVGLKANGTVVAAGDNTDGRCDVAGWTDIVAVSAGWLHTVGLKSDGTVVAVGSNKYNRCDVAEWTDIVAVSAGGSHTVGLKADGTAVAVGFNNTANGQCSVTDWTDIVAISAGQTHTVGLKSDGTVVAVGNGYAGVKHGFCDVTDWTDIVAVSAGGNHTVGLKSNGTVVAVGNNENGQCNVKGWRNIVAISAGLNHTVGLRADGSVVAVGKNENGQCYVTEWKDIKVLN